MAVSKNKKRRGKDGTKAKKCNVKKIVPDSECTVSNIFNTDEQQELKKILNTSSLTSMPLIVGAAILGKLDVVKKLFINGTDESITATDKSKSLIWAIKSKNLAMIHLLISQGADASSLDDSGEKIIFTALNSSDWNENLFLQFWNIIKMDETNLEAASKTGNRIIHFAVKRQWMALIQTLIKDKVDINSCNNKGVSALTMAAARNDLKIVDVLLKAGADVLQEDMKGNTPICYSIVNIVRKDLKPPYETFDSLTRNLCIYGQYIQRRFDLLINPPNNDWNSYNSNINKITSCIIVFIMKRFENGADLLINSSAFDLIKQAIETHMEHLEYLQSLLNILSLLLSWCDCCTKPKNKASQLDISEKFIESSLPDVLIYVLKHDTKVLPEILLPLILTCQSTSAKNWLKNNLQDLDKYSDVCLNDFNIKEDELHTKIVKNKIQLFKETVEQLKTELSTALITTKIQEVIDEKIEPVQYGKKRAKRMRRKAKALKARIDKIRSADVVERTRTNVKNRTSSSSTVKELEKSLGTLDDKEIIEIKPSHPIDSSSNESINNIITSSKIQDIPELYSEIKVYDKNREHFEASLIKLRIILNDIVCKYRNLWNLDAKKGHPLFMGGGGDNKEELLADLTHFLPFIEKQYLSKLNDSFNKTINKIEELYQQNNEYYKVLSNQLKKLLIGHEIRGKKYFKKGYKNPKNQKINYKKYDIQNNLIIGDYYVPCELSPQDIIFLDDLSKIYYQASTLTEQERVINEYNTKKDAYHLAKSAYDVCDNQKGFDGWDEEFISPYMKKMMEKAAENKEKKLPVQKVYPLSYYMQQDEPKNPENREMILYQSNEKVSRWESRIQSLQTLVRQQIIIKGGNFGAGVLGFDKNGEPVIIKKIFTFTAQQIYAWIESVLQVRHKHILSYTTCSFDPSAPSLFLGTPLCEYNLGEYVMRLKTQQTQPIIAKELAFDILLGLEHLHRSKPAPIVHGNLKPSNILIDLRGKVRLAEFGLYETLYVRETPPKSSLIWFARETYEAYVLNRKMICSLATDVQVAGMLVHFILTWGLHVFGSGTDDILFNLVAGKPNIQISGVEAQDLISWMVVYESGARPTIGQALNHFYFWLKSDKWAFILNFSGLSETGYPLSDFPLNRLHAHLETEAKRQGLVGNWPSTIKKQFSHLQTFLTDLEESNTPVGLLKFTRRVVFHDREKELKEVFFSGFPTLPLTLFRLIDNTEWIEHPVFKKYFRY